MSLTVHGSKWESPQPMRLQHSKVGSVLALALGAAALGACIPTVNQSPDAASLDPLPCYGSQCVPTAPSQQSQGAPVTLQPSATLPDCNTAYQGLEFFKDINGNEVDILNNENGTAQYFYQYVDGTAGIWPAQYSPPAIQQEKCQHDPTETNHLPTNRVLHESGGPFYGWGGGIGIGLAHINTDGPVRLDGTTAAGICSNSMAQCQGKGGWSQPGTPCTCPPQTPAVVQPPAVFNDNGNHQQLSMATSSAALDVSQWDGISFWARRGPAGQPLMRVLVGDAFTDDDISFLMYVGNAGEKRLCERKGECTCAYQDTSCDWYAKTDPNGGQYVNPDSLLLSPLNTGGYYCGAPASHPGAASSNAESSNGGIPCMSTSGICGNNYCGRTLCDQPYPAYGMIGPDPEWAGRACTPFTYRNGTQADLCYNPTGTVDATGKSIADPLPAESDEQCGDHFTFPVELSENWQFFTIPFAEMSQQGWAKQAPYFDLTTASVVRFTWDVGFVDYYLDDVRFYRLAGKPATTPPP
ncbi:MAG TPA: hypothetical protein VN853_12950 [Polyangia bacterium]|nr:hypothetical protein [Polyangia bacterium]